MTTFSAEAIELLEFAMGPRSRRGMNKPVAFAASKAITDFGWELSSAPFHAGFSAFGKGSNAERSANAVATLKRTVDRHPEVMVKFTGRQSDAAHVAANFAYISRLGRGADKELELLTSECKSISSKSEMEALADKWYAWELADELRRNGATSLSMVLSMPEGTDSSKVLIAAKRFAETEMANRRWVLALHNDCDHPHAHLTIARRDLDGQRFRPWWDDIFRYRQVFAEKLRDLGVEANATPRKARGVAKKATKMSVHQMRKRGVNLQIDQLAKAEIISAFQSGVHRSEFDKWLIDQRIEVAEAYHRAAVELYGAQDRQYRELAWELGQFFKSMSPPLTKKTMTIRRIVTAQKELNLVERTDSALSKKIVEKRRGLER